MSYDCRDAAHTVGRSVHALWSRVCSHAAVRHEIRHDHARLRAGDEPHPDPHEVGRRIGQRTLYIFGDSHALDLWCAMSCWLLRAGDAALNSVEADCVGKGCAMHTNVTNATAPRRRFFAYNVSAAKPPRGATYFVVARRLSPDDNQASAFEVAFRVPTCATGKGGHCGVGTHCGTLGREPCSPGCGWRLFDALPSRVPAVVLYSPCPSYLASDTHRVLTNALNTPGAPYASLRGFAQLSHPLRDLCGAAPGSSSSSKCTLLRDGAAPRFAKVASTAARQLRELRERTSLPSTVHGAVHGTVNRGFAPRPARSAVGGEGHGEGCPRSLTLLVPSPVAHFPEVAHALDHWSDARLDGIGSHERHVGSALMWLHALLRSAGAGGGGVVGGASGGTHRAVRGVDNEETNRSLVGVGGGGGSTMVETLAAALGLGTVAPTSFRGEGDRFEPSLALGIAQALARSRSGGATRVGDVAHHMLLADANATLAMVGRLTPDEVMGQLRATACATHSRVDELDASAEVGIALAGAGTSGVSGVANGVARVAGAARHAKTRAASSVWRQRLESSAARAEGVPYLLDGVRARLARWDLHPGLQGGRGASPRRRANRFDCTHSSLAQGSFDGEMLGLQKALREEGCG